MAGPLAREGELARKTLEALTGFGHSIGEVARLSLEELKGLLVATHDLSQSK